MNLLILGPSDMFHLRQFVRELSVRGHRVHVVSMKSQPVPGATFERFAVPPFSLHYPYRWQARWRAKVRDWFRRYDLVNVHFLADWGIDDESASRGRLSCYVYGSDVVHVASLPPPPQRLAQVRKQLVRCAHSVAVSGVGFRSTVASFAGIPPDRVTTLPLGVATQLFKPAPSKTRHPVTVGYFKGFEPVYDPMLAVETAALLLHRSPDVRFEFIGEGQLRDACQARAKQLGIDSSIRWLGRLPQTTLAEHLRRWDVALFTSIAESFCLSALEASAAAVPVVAPAVGGLNETIIHGQTGVLTPNRDARTLAQEIHGLLIDPERRRLMGSTGRKRVLEQFQRGPCMDRIVRHFERIANRRARTPASPRQAPDGLARTEAQTAPAEILDR